MKNVLRGGILDKLLTTISFQNVTLFLILMTALISPSIFLSFPNAMNMMRLKCDWSGCAKVENQFMDIWTTVWKQIEAYVHCTYLSLKELEM